MIKTENFTINDTEFVRTYSDENKYVVRDGVSYEEACDPAEFGRTYTEGGVIERVEEPNEEEFAQAGRIMMGVPQWT